MSEDTTFETLLAWMPRIAEAVNAFASEAVQQDAFRALLEASGAAVPAEAPLVQERASHPRRKGSAPSRTRRPSANGDGTRAKRSSSAPSMLRDLNLAPKGKKSFREFVAEKTPKTNNDKNAVSVYYLARILEEPAVTVDHVFTCYRDRSWRPAPNFANSLQLTASRKAWIDTKSMQDIKLTPRGEIYVEHDLPVETGE